MKRFLENILIVSIILAAVVAITMIAPRTPQSRLTGITISTFGGDARGDTTFFEVEDLSISNGGVFFNHLGNRIYLSGNFMIKFPQTEQATNRRE
jgi:hypothetical protein